MTAAPARGRSRAPRRGHSQCRWPTRSPPTGPRTHLQFGNVPRATSSRYRRLVSRGGGTGRHAEWGAVVEAADGLALVVAETGVTLSEARAATLPPTSIKPRRHFQ